VLERYYQDFPVYNPYLDRVPSKKTKNGATSFKYYDVDGSNAGSEVKINGKSEELLKISLFLY